MHDRRRPANSHPCFPDRDDTGERSPGRTAGSVARIALLGVLLWAAPGSAEPVLLDRIVAEVNGDIITLSEVGERIERLEQEMRSYLEPEEFLRRSRSQRSQALQTMIDELLILQEAESLGVEVSESDVDRGVENIKQENDITSDTQFRYLLQAQGFTVEEYRGFLRRQILLFRTRRQTLGEVQVTDEELRQYYERNREDFRLPDTVHLRHILLRVPEGASAPEVESVRRRAEDVLSTIRGGGDFRDLARRLSDDPSAPNGGDIGFISRGNMLPEFEAVAFDVPVGKVSEPVRTKYGFHLIQVVERREEQYQPLEEVKDRLREFLEAQRLEERQDQWLGRLRAQAFVKIYGEPGEPPVIKQPTLESDLQQGGASPSGAAGPTTPPASP